LLSSRVRTFGFPVFVASADDRYSLRLHGLRHLADEVDHQQAVLEGSPLHRNIAGELEHAPEWQRGNPLVQVFAQIAVWLRALNGQRVLLGSYGNIVDAEAGQCQANPVVILTGSFDIVGWISVVGALSTTSAT
jgi:hypothetical protein